MFQQEQEVVFYRNYLKEEYARRMHANPRYSIRAFARDLNLDSSFLTKILSNKASLSYSTGARVVARLRLSPSVQELFVQSILEEKKKEIFEEIRRLSAGEEIQTT